MEGFELFPKIKGAIKWMAEHSDSVIHFGWNVVAAIILLFIGKLIARLLSRGLEKLLLRRQVDATIVHFFSALVRYITIAFTAVAALGRVGIETSSIIAVIGAAGLAIGLALQGHFPTLPQAYCLSPCVLSAPGKLYKLAWLSAQ